MQAVVLARVLEREVDLATEGSVSLVAQLFILITIDQMCKNTNN
jgi:hypothetical protein